MTENYCEMAMLLQYGGFENATAEDEELLHHFIAVASAFIDEKTGRTFAVASTAPAIARTYSLDNGLLPALQSRTLWLEDDLCVVPVFAEVPAPTVTYIPAAPPYNRIVRALASGYWPDPTVITGYWAYSMTPPLPIVQLCLRVATWLHRAKEGEGEDRPIVTASGLVLMPSALPRDIQELIDLYRKPVRA